MLIYAKYVLLRFYVEKRWEMYCNDIYRRKFRSPTSDNMNSWKSSAARKKINRCGKKEDPQARNVREVAKCCVFSMFCVSAGSKSNLSKAAGAEVALQRTQEKLHAAVARSTFWSQNAKKLTGSDHFLKLRCWKIARRCSEKHIFKSKCTKHVMGGPLFEVAMWKNGTPL